MYSTDRLKHLIGEASFDGWVENDSPNCDGFEEHVQLLKEIRALEIIEEAKSEFPQSCVDAETRKWFKRWFTREA